MITEDCVVSEQMRLAFEKDGYFILEAVIPPEHLNILREECRLGMEEADRKMAEEGTAVRGITHKGKRYFLSNRSKQRPDLRAFLFSPLMAEICRATLGPEAMLFFEQFVVKSPRQGTPFGWHQDSGYIGYPHKPYLTCWCALDDMREENGTVYILPYSKAGSKEMISHTREEGSNDKIGYFGKDPGIPVIVPAGSIAVFSSTTFHRSGENSSPNPRQVYVAQYSAEPILSEDGTHLRQFAEPILQDGRYVNLGDENGAG